MISSERGIGSVPPTAFVAGDVLHAEFAEEFAAPLQFLIQPLQHAQAKLAIALDGHDRACGSRFVA